MNKCKCHKPLFFRCFVAFLMFIFFGAQCVAQEGDSARPEGEQEWQTKKNTNAFDALSTTDKTLTQTRKVNRQQLEKLKAEDEFWYVNEAPKRAKPAPKENSNSYGSFFANEWIRTLMWVVLTGVFIAILRWFIIAGNNPFYIKKPKRIKATGEKGGAAGNIFDINFDEEIRTAVAAKNYRLAVRLHYLSLLERLDALAVISYSSERTNSDYLHQLANSVYYTPFFSLTRSFEYSWYGKFWLTKDAFERIEEEFLSFTKRYLQ